MSSLLKNKFEDLDLTPDELKRFSEAFRKEEFKKLFADYAKEISDPANKKLYEEEIQQLEKEKGMDVKFVHPEPGYVLKAIANGDTKTFVNVCTSEHVGSPNSERRASVDGKDGHSWSIPHLFSQPREDLAKNKCRCLVYDFIIHPHTYRMAETNSLFRKMINNLAVDGLQKMFNLCLDKNNFKQIRMKYKGHITCSVIRNRVSNFNFMKQDDILSMFPYPYGDDTSAEQSEKMTNDYKLKVQPKDEKSNSKVVEYINYTTPKFELKCQTDVDLQHHVQCQRFVTSTRPQRLILDIFLPLLSTASSINLDVFERSIKLLSHSPAKYYLELNLPYPIAENASKAKFDKFKHKLNVVLAVLSYDCLVVEPSHKILKDENAKSLEGFNEPMLCQRGKDVFKLHDELETGNCQNICGKDLPNKSEICQNPRKKDVLCCDKKEIGVDQDNIFGFHEKQNSTLQGILKKSSSISCEDHCGTLYYQLTSGEDEDDDFEEGEGCNSLPSSFGSKKSVSFNDHVDKTVFQINQSISSLHAKLKNKKKKIKKKYKRFENQSLKQDFKNCNSSSCGSALGKGMEDSKKIITDLKDSTPGTCSILDSEIEKSHIQFVDQSNLEKRSNPVNSVTSGHNKELNGTTILNWDGENFIRNVVCSVHLDNNHTFSLDWE